MSLEPESASRAAPTSRSMGRVSRTREGDPVVTIRGSVVRLSAVLALLAAGVVVPFGVVALFSGLAVLPAALVSTAALLATAFVAPFVAVGFAATLLE